jgi:multidrug efflux pump subunit AcrA (membrane-fusion protein)
MNSFVLRGLLTFIVVTALPGAYQFTASAADPVIEALVKFDKDILLPAKEAGVLVELNVKEGDTVKAGQAIGRIDDSQPQMQKKAARYARDAAVKRAEDDVEIEYSKLQAAVAEKDYEILVETNRRAAGAVSVVEVRRAKLDWDRSVKAIEKSSNDQELSRLEAWTKQAELEAAELAISRRKISAPFDGQIVEISHKQDEWVNPGDPILRLAQRDVMHVEGAIHQHSDQEGSARVGEFDPHELRGCPVSVKVQLARGHTETVDGRIIYVSPVLTYDGRYIVRAEVPNLQVGGNWILMDGQKAEMTIHINAAGPEAEISRRP